MKYHKSVRRVVRSIKKSCDARSIIGLLLVIPLVIPFGQTNATTTQVAPVDTVEPQLIALNSNIVEVQAKSVSLPVVKAAEKPAPRPTVQRASIATVKPVADVDFATKRDWVQKAAAAHGIDWKILEAVWQIESGKRWQTTITSYAGASGPCQFMPGTWRAYASDGNGDGVKDSTYAPDCLFGAAKLLSANGASSGKVTQALLRYNHSMSYVNKVLQIANSISG